MHRIITITWKWNGVWLPRTATAFCFEEYYCAAVRPEKRHHVRQAVWIVGCFPRSTHIHTYNRYTISQLSEEVTLRRGFRTLTHVVFVVPKCFVCEIVCL